METIAIRIAITGHGTMEYVFVTMTGMVLPAIYSAAIQKHVKAEENVTIAGFVFVVDIGTEIYVSIVTLTGMEYIQVAVRVPMEDLLTKIM